MTAVLLPLQVGEATVLQAAAVGYAVVLLGLLVGVRRVDASLRRYCYPLVLLAALATADSLWQAAGGGSLVVNGNAIQVSTATLDVYAYTVLYGGTTLLAGASRRLVAAVTGVAVTMRVAFSVGNAAAPGTPLATLAAVGILGGYPVVVGLYLRPVWRVAQRVPARQRLLHWKARNLQLFLFGMLVVYAFLLLSGLIQNAVVSQVLVQYPNLLFRGGVSLLIVHRLAGFEGRESLRLGGGAADAGTNAEEPASAGEAAAGD